MKIIGLTGGIGSGKSTVAKMFRSLGAKIIDADEIAREIVEPYKTAWKELVSEFGEMILNENRSLNRGLVADMVFKDDTKREKLNGIVHPKIRDEIMCRIDEYRSQKAKVVIIEAALLVEKKGLLSLVDELIVVSVDERSRLKRIKERDNLTDEEILSRIRSQFSNKEKVDLADFLIDNAGNVERTEGQVKKIWESL